MCRVSRLFDGAADGDLLRSGLAESVDKSDGLSLGGRYEKPGLCERTSIRWRSEVDVREAEQVGRAAVDAVLAEKGGIMIGIERLSSSPYRIRLIDIPVEQVMLYERRIPDNWINARGNGVTQELLDWCRPLVGDQSAATCWQRS